MIPVPGHGTSWMVMSMITLFVGTSDSFNFAPHLATIKRGVPDSYFGYSVAEHLIIPDRDIHTEPFLLVGAPRGQGKQPGTNRSGVVYKCPYSSSYDDCVPLVFEQENKPPDPSISKDDQWLGVSLKSGPDGYVSTCAHRYRQVGPDYQWGQGICYSFTKYLDYQMAWEPCFGRPVNKAHEQFGFCMAGTSVDISHERDIVIGSPGPYTWRGTVFSNNIRFGLKDDNSWYIGPVVENMSPVDKYSYLGMSVTSGHFFGSNMSFVGGAPRSKGTGQVVFFKKNKPQNQYNIQLMLDGEMFGSQFGYSLESVDVNGDKKLDLLVGAPFFHNKTEGGAVYVYINSGDSLKRNRYSQRLTGHGVECRFGFAISKLGDINKDGFNDVAIGAPYTEGGGAVYIYLGSPDGLKQEPVQVIRSADLPYKFLSTKTFGYSLSGSIDMDKNGYPDLLVGAYESDTAILIRTRPIIDIVTSVEGELTNIDSTNMNCIHDPNVKQVCFSFRACFQMRPQPHYKLTAGVIKLTYKIEAETFTGRKYYRVKFKSTETTDQPNIVEKDIVITYPDNMKSHCSDEVVFLKDKIDIQNPIQFKLTYSLQQDEPPSPQPGYPNVDLNQYPILNQMEAHKIFEAKFHKDCGTNDVCESDLVVSGELHLPVENGDKMLYLGEENVNLTLRVINQHEPAYEASVYITHPQSLSFVGKKSLNGEQMECLPQGKTLLRCELGNPFPKKAETVIQLRFSPKAVLDEEQSITFTIEANTTSQDISPETNSMALHARVVRIAELEIRGSTEPDQVFYGGDIKGESAMVYEEDVGSLVTHTYVVSNRGPWKVRRLEVAIDWPYEVENGKQHGKWLLYLLETQVQGDGYCETGEFLNPLRLRKSREEPEPESVMNSYSRKQKRIKREMVVLPEEVKEDGKSQQIVTMDCIKKSAKCLKFSCFLTNLKADQTAVIKIKSRLWNSTFVEDYAYGISQVHINSHARIKLDSSLDIKQQRYDNDNAFAKTKAYPDLPLLPPQEAPLWIIILAVILGIILLVLLVGVLWKLGFFERKKYAHLSTEDDQAVTSAQFN